MEHLLPALGNTGITAPIVIQCLADDEFDGEFDTFPERKGWNVSSWQWANEASGFDRNDRTIYDIASFLQSWLFFGVLRTVLNIDEPKTHYTRLGIGDVGLITTAQLPRHVELWKDRHHSADEEAREQSLDAEHAILSMSGNVCEALSYHLIYGEYVEDTGPLKEALFAAHLLCDTLKDVHHQLRFGRAGRGTPKPDPLLRDRLLARGWCISTVEYVQKVLPFQLQPLALALGSERTLDDHKMCTEERCTINQFQPDYRPVHVYAGCECEPISVPQAEVVNMLEEGLVPIVGIEISADDCQRVSMRVHGVDFDGEDVQKYGAPYVAITHVWSDGLGNPQENALPACQLKRLAALLGTLRNSYASTIANAFDLPELPIWLDTLCIPVLPEHQRLRDFSISKMNQIYHKAAGVLVLDKDIQKLSEDVSLLEVLVRVLCSGWRSRLWTFQEGTLARALHLPVQGRCIDFGGVNDSLDEADCEGLIENQLFQMASLSCYRYVYNTHVQTKEDRPGQHLEQLIHAACHRSTTRGGDETICIATFLGLNPSPLLDQPVEKRMVTLLRMLPILSSMLLFTRGPRVTEDGFRWAPQSLLNPFGLQDFHSFRLDRRYVTEDGDEILVPTPHLSRHGSLLNVFFSALQFERPVSEESDILSIRISDDEVYLIEHVDSGSGIDWAPRVKGQERERLAILMTDLEHGSMCLMVALEDDDDAGCRRGSWRSLVLVNKIGDFFEDDSIDVAMQHCYDGYRHGHRWWQLH